MNGASIIHVELAGPGGNSPVNMNDDNRGLDMTAWNGSQYETISNFYLGYSNVHGFVNGLWMYNVANSTIENTRLADMAALNSVAYHANVIVTVVSTNITFRYNEITNWQVEGIMWIFGGASNSLLDCNLWHDGMGGASGTLTASSRRRMAWKGP